MQQIAEPLPGVKLIELQCFGDERGSFTETFNRAKMAKLGIDHEFVQDNESVSEHTGTVRGLHLQLPPYAQGKLVRATRGRVFDVAVDLRPGSSTYLESCSVMLDGDDSHLFWVPPGFGHGFCTLAPGSIVSYKVTALYSPEADRSLLWNDPAIGIEWPVERDAAILSDKDANAPALAELQGELSGAFR